MKRKTVIERNAEYARADLENGETLIISARYGRSDYNGNHVRAVDNYGRVLGRASGGNYDLKSAAMWEAVQGVLKAPTDQIASHCGRYRCIYANFGDTWREFFGQFGWNVVISETYRNGCPLDYVATISKRKNA